MTKPNELMYEERYEKMVEFQEEIKPFTPTVRDFSTVWGLSGTSPALACIKQMIKRGMIVFRETGEKKGRKQYYARKSSRNGDSDG